MSVRVVANEELRPQGTLKPCPFDGSERLVVVKTLRFPGAVGAEDEPDAYAYNVHCLGCACDGPWKKSQGGAEQIWNGLPGTTQGSRWLL